MISIAVDFVLEGITGFAPVRSQHDYQNVSMVTWETYNEALEKDVAAIEPRWMKWFCSQPQWMTWQ